MKQYLLILLLAILNIHPVELLCTLSGIPQDKLVPIFIGINCFAQPPAAYKKQMKQQKKAGKKTGKVKGNKRSAEKIKKYKQQITKLEKQEMDARASRDQEKADKTKRTIGWLKAKMGIEKDKLEKKIIKKYQKIQTKEVRKRMKKSKKKANRVNENKREFFLIRWFSPKHRK